MRIVCWQTILMKYHTLFFFRNLEKNLQNLSSAAVVIDTLRVPSIYAAGNIIQASGPIRRCLFIDYIISSFVAADSSG